MIGRPERLTEQGKANGHIPPSPVHVAVQCGSEPPDPCVFAGTTDCQPAKLRPQVMSTPPALMQNQYSLSFPVSSYLFFGVLLQYRQESFLWYLNTTHLFHAFFTGLLFFQQLAFSCHITAIALGCNVLA